MWEDVSVIVGTQPLLREVPGEQALENCPAGEGKTPNLSSDKPRSEEEE